MSQHFVRLIYSIFFSYRSLQPKSSCSLLLGKCQCFPLQEPCQMIRLPKCYYDEKWEWMTLSSQEAINTSQALLSNHILQQIHCEPLCCFPFDILAEQMMKLPLPPHFLKPRLDFCPWPGINPLPAHDRQWDEWTRLTVSQALWSSVCSYFIPQGV